MSFWDNVKKFAQPYADDDYDDYDEDEEYLDDYEEPAAPARRAPARRRAPEPAPVEEFEDEEAEDFGFGLTAAPKAADDLRSRKAVVLNLENVDKAMSRRVVDFLSGCVYALDGSVKKVAQSAYIFCPHNMDVVGDLEAIQAEIESYV